MNEHKFLPYAYASNFRLENRRMEKNLNKNNISEFKKLAGNSLIKLGYEKKIIIGKK